MAEDSNAAIRRWMVKTAGGLLVLAAALFGSAGTLRWSGAWCYWGLAVAAQVATALGAPELMAQRAGVPSDAKRWDMPLAIGVSMVGPVSIAVVAGLDLRLGWIGYVSPATFGTALGVLALSTALIAWAMIVNRHFAPVVSIADSQRVVQSGPYRFVRHPGYLAGLLATLATPYVLGSRWAVFPAYAVALLLVIRTRLEDRTLLEELPGYREYARRVKARLIPGIW